MRYQSEKTHTATHKDLNTKWFATFKNKLCNSMFSADARVVSPPPYSPDLNPCDFFLWDNIEQRMARSAPKNAKESLAKYKARLRKTATATSKHLVRKALLNMKPRVQAIYEAKGRDIDMD